MKKLVNLLAILISSLSIIIYPGCKDDNNNPDNEWTEEDQKAYDELENLQSQCVDVFDNYLLTMDTVSAKAALAAWFESDPAVAWARISDQGVSVEYTSGLRGGIMINDLRQPSGDSLEFPSFSHSENDLAESDPLLKLMPKSNKVLAFDPTYTEFITQSQPTYSAYDHFLPKVGMQLAAQDRYFDDKATLEVLKKLSGYGHIIIYTHGYAWPNTDNLVDVYIMTGQEMNETTSKAYKDDIELYSIITVTNAITKKTNYFVSAIFITSHNEFKEDTTLIYGGFCYGYLGSWTTSLTTPEFGACTYVSADWAVAADYSAGWALELIAVLTEKKPENPYRVIDWYLTSNLIPKSYVNKDGKTVNVKYSGRPDLTFWKKVTATIKPADPGGAPVTIAGKKNTPYKFNCPINGAPVREIKLEWNFGDGTPAEVIEKDTSVTHTWTMDGNFQVTVDVKDLATDEILASDTVTVNIAPNMDLLAMLHTVKNIQLGLPSEHHYLSNGETIGIGGTYIYSNILGDTSKLNWNGTNFSVAGIDISGWNLNIYGSFSADGQTLISLYAHKWVPPPTLMQEITIELANLAVTNIIPEIPSAAYYLSGSETQAHVTNFEYQQWDYNTHSWATYTYSDWPYVSIEVLFTGHNK